MRSPAPTLRLFDHIEGDDYRDAPARDRLQLGEHVVDLHAADLVP